MIVERVGKDGKTTYMVRVNGVEPVSKRRLRKVVGTYRRKRDAERAEQKALVDIRAGTFEWAKPEPTRLWTVSAAVEGWLTGRKPMVADNTYSTYESAYRLHLRDAIGFRDVTALTRADVKILVRTWQDAGMGEQLQNRSMLVLRCALDEAVEDGILTANPATGIRLPSPKKRRDLPVWTPEHLRGFLAVGERDQLGAFWHLTALEGMRRAEALGLRWGDLHWSADESRCTATIVQTTVANMAEGGAALVQPRAKTRGSQRTISLTTSTVEALKRHRDRQSFRKQALAEMWGAHDLIVTNEIGGVVRPDAVDRHRVAVMTEAQVPVIRTHDLRHHAATTMLRAGISPAIVAAKIGHTDIGLTVDTYGHLVPEDQAEANAAVEAFLATPVKELA